MSSSTTRRAFTLVETIAVMVIVGTLSAVLSTVLYAATDAYASAEDGRRAIDDASRAIETITREIRSQPAPQDSSLACGLLSATETSLEFESGLRIELDGTDLLLTRPALGAATLLTGVESLTFRLFADGAPDAPALGPDDEPGNARVIEVSIDAGTGPLSTRLFLRSSLGVGS